MILPRRTCRFIAGALALLAFSLSAQETSGQVGGPIAFRRDRLPLSAEAMARLSVDLEFLSCGLAGETPEEQTAARRMVALAMALDPANPKLRTSSDVKQETSDPSRIHVCHTRIWRIIAWLETEAAGEHGNKVANCLKDVMVISNPEHPQVADLRAGGEKGSWLGWVPEPEKELPKETTTTAEEAPPEVVEETVVNDPVALADAETIGLLRQADKNRTPGVWTYAPHPLRMKARQMRDGDGSQFIVIGSVGKNAAPLPLADQLEKLMVAHHGTLPRGVRIHIFSDRINLAAPGPPQHISAAAAVLTSAAITGQEPDAIIIGHMDASGALVLPQDFWQQLKALGPGKGRRLVLPAAAATWLPSMIAMEKPEFFLEYEVLLADDFSHLLALSAKKTDEAVTQAAAKFREIRERLGTQDVNAYLSNRYVRQRLEDISKSLTFHASASMMLLHGSPNRPTTISRKVLAEELLTAIQPMAWIKPSDDPRLLHGAGLKFTDIYKTCLLPMDQIEPYVAKDDRDALESAKSLTKALWSFSRSVRRSGDTHLEFAETQVQLIEFQQLFSEVELQIRRAAESQAP